MSIGYIILLIEIVGDAVELRKRIVAGLYLRTPLDHLGTIVRLDVFPLLGADGKYMVVRHFGYPWTMSLMSLRSTAQLFQKFSSAGMNPDLAVSIHGNSSMNMTFLPSGSVSMYCDKA